MGRIIRHEILEYLTDRPGVVVYKNDIVEATGFEARQVTAVMLSLTRDTLIGNEIDVLVPGNAWRFRPNQPAMVATSTQKADLGRPLTELIRKYFYAHPNELVQIEHLVAYTGRNEEKVKVGINNVKINRPLLRHRIQTIVPGQTWRYVLTDPAVPDVTRSGRPAPTSSTPVVPVAPITDVATSANGATSSTGRLFEEVGSIDDAIIVRDDTGTLYRAVKLN